MCDDLLPLIEKLMESIAALEPTVDDLLFAAHQVADPSAAEVLRSVARRHRVKILEMQGQFAALAERYVDEVYREP